MSDEPKTISIIHPDLYNRALRDFGVKGVRAIERDGKVSVEVIADAVPSPIGELVNAIGVAHIKLIAAESQVSLLTSAKRALANVIGQQAGDHQELEDAIETLEQVITNLSGIAREP